MSTSVAGLSTNYFPSPQSGFTTTTSGSVGSGAATVGLNSVAGYSNGEIAVFVIDPTDVSKKQTFTGVIDTSGSQVTSVKWTAGTNQTHALGATVVDYATATHISMMAKGILVEHNQDGTHGAVTATSLTTSGNVTIGGSLTIGGSGSGGYDPITGTVTAVTANGNHSYSLTTSADNTALISPGMRLRSTRTVAAPIQCTSLNGTTQYYSKTSPAGMTFTDDFVAGAWVKLSSYADGDVVSCLNGTQGWELRIDVVGQVSLIGYNAALGNYSQVKSYQSVPLNKWVHIAAQLDMSAFTATTTTSYVMFDGKDVPSSVSRAGTNPTALVQAGDLNIGAVNGGTRPFPGKIAQVAIYNAKVTQATILASINQGLSGSETSLASAYSFNNAITDLNTTNANNLTANGAAVATNADSPFGGQAGGTISSTLDYGIVQTVSASTIVVQVAEGCTIPTSGGVSAVSYSSVKSPFGFPSQTSKWRISTLQKVDANTTSNATYGAYNNNGFALTTPIGEWNMGWQAAFYITSTTEVTFNLSATPLTGMSAVAGANAAPFSVGALSSAAAYTISNGHVRAPQTIAAQSTYVIYSIGATTAAGIGGSKYISEIFAENAYL